MSTATTTETQGAPPAAEAQAAPQPAATPRPERAMVKFDANDPVSLYMDSGVFEQLQRVGKMMSESILVPDHFKKKVGDCALVAAQSFRWRMDPFAVVQHTFVYKGKLGYEGKLIAAVVNSSGKLQSNLRYEYSGSGKDRKIVVSGRLKGEEKDRTVEGTVKDWATDNDMWTKDPDQILSYRGAREWARRHMPEVLLGVHADEEVKQIVEMERGADGTFAARPTLDTLADDLNANAGAPPEPAPAPQTCDHAGARQYLVDKSGAPTGDVAACPDCGEEVKLAQGKVVSATAATEEAAATKPAAVASPSRHRTQPKLIE